MKGYNFSELGFDRMVIITAVLGFAHQIHSCKFPVGQRNPEVLSKYEKREQLVTVDS